MVMSIGSERKMTQKWKTPFQWLSQLQFIRFPNISIVRSVTHCKQHTKKILIFNDVVCTYFRDDGIERVVLCVCHEIIVLVVF